MKRKLASDSLNLDLKEARGTTTSVATEMNVGVEDRKAAKTIVTTIDKNAKNAKRDRR